MKLIKYSFMILFIFLFLMILEIQASSPALKITPSRFELLLEPRGRTFEVIKITNNAEEAVTMQVNIKDWDLNETRSILLLDSGSSKRSASNWVRFNPRKFTINSGETQIVRYAVTIPPQVSSGEYRTSIVLQTEEKYEMKEGSSYQPVFAIMVYVNVPEVNRAWKVNDIQISKNKTNKYAVKGKLEALGNAHLRVVGEYYIFDEQENVIENMSIGKMVVLPGKIDDFYFSPESELKSGVYKLKIIWKSIPAFYLEGSLKEYPVDHRVVEIEKELVID